MTGLGIAAIAAAGAAERAQAGGGQPGAGPGESGQASEPNDDWTPSAGAHEEPPPDDESWKNGPNKGWDENGGGGGGGGGSGSSAGAAGAEGGLRRTYMPIVTVDRSGGEVSPNAPSETTKMRMSSSKKTEHGGYTRAGVRQEPNQFRGTQRSVPIRPH